MEDDHLGTFGVPQFLGIGLGNGKRWQNKQQRGKQSFHEWEFDGS
jgi:hypothetical protein